MEAISVSKCMTLLLTLSLGSNPTISASTKSINPPQNQPIISLPLKNMHSNKNMTTLDRLIHRARTDSLRLQRFAPSSPQLESPLSPGSGEFLMKISIGTPPKPYSAIIDTGSDLIWTQCEPCQKCFPQSTPIFNPKESSSFSRIPCGSPLCGMSCSGSGTCRYAYSYGDYSSTEGYMGRETFRFGEKEVKNIVFGCGEDNEGNGYDQGAGIVGFGRGRLSLISQLRVPQFAYCLPSIDDRNPGRVLIGSVPVEGTPTPTTPMLQNPVHQSFYYLELHAITVGMRRLPLHLEFSDEGTGGVIADSGTTLTYLEERAFDEVKNAFVEETPLEVRDGNGLALDLCFNLPDSDEIEVPRLVLHFQGADLELPLENYMIADSGLGVVCLAMGRSSGVSILGNVLQQNMLVIHDLRNRAMSFTPMQCSHL